jgi:hypothetical protein
VSQKFLAGKKLLCALTRVDQEDDGNNPEKGKSPWEVN